MPKIQSLPAKNARKEPKPKTVHIREKVSPKTSPTFCGGSHSPIWFNKELSTVPPQQAEQATCGRCRRVAAARKLI